MTAYDDLPDDVAVLLTKARQALTALEGATYRRAGHLHLHPDDLDALRRHLAAPADGGLRLYDREVVDGGVTAGEVRACLGPVPEPVRALAVGGSLNGRWITLENEVDVLDSTVEPLLVPPGERYTLTIAHAFGRVLRLYVGPCDDLDALLAEHLLIPAASTIERPAPKVRPAWLN